MGIPARPDLLVDAPRDLELVGDRAPAQDGSLDQHVEEDGVDLLSPGQAASRRLDEPVAHHLDVERAPREGRHGEEHREPVAHALPEGQAAQR